MRYYLVFSILVLLFFSATSLKANCPNPSLGETQSDCPWAEIGRDLASVVQSPAELDAVLINQAPELVKQWRFDGKKESLKSLWGRSVNFDEGAKGIIVAPEILEAIALYFHPTIIPSYFQGREVVHAGMEHTYGYLFSLLRTPYGYKRARWVSGEIEQGMGLPKGILGPIPSEGTLFSNVTYLAGRIAFRNTPSSQKLLEEDKDIPSILKNYSFENLNPVRLEEKLEIKEGQGARTITIWTDFVPFPKQSGGSNTHWLIYTLIENQKAQPKLITAFPVNESTLKQSTNPDTLGENQPVQLRYNAFTEDIYGVKLQGTRTLVR